MMPFNRMQNIFRPRQQSQYPIYDKFESEIAPFIDISDMNTDRRALAQSEQQRYDLNQANNRQADMMNYKTASEERLRNIASNMTANKPMNVVLGDHISPYQKAQLDLRNRELGLKEQLGEGNLDFKDRQLAEAGEKNEGMAGHRTATLEETKRKNFQKEQDTFSDPEKLNADIQKIDRTTHGRNETTRIRGELNKELTALRHDNSMRAIERRAEISKDLISLGGEEQRETNAAKPITSTGKKTEIITRTNEFLNNNPHLEKYVTIGKDGLPIVANEAAPYGGIMGIGAKEGLSKEVRAQILNGIYGGSSPTYTNKSTETNKPPEGATPKGKYVTSKSGRRVWMEEK